MTNQLFLTLRWRPQFGFVTWQVVEENDDHQAAVDAAVDDFDELHPHEMTSVVAQQGLTHVVPRDEDLAAGLRYVVVPVAEWRRDEPNA